MYKKSFASTMSNQYTLQLKPFKASVTKALQPCPKGVNNTLAKL
jgi:hypothetical protein